jgi:chromosome segregation ATPase
MSENQEEACQEIEKLREENSKLREEWLELTDELLSYTGLPGQMHRIDVKIEQLKSLLIRAADALEKSPDGDHSHLVQELRKAAG